ncbi:hypothetical protein A2U01_0076980, partial [Trifolium medium]|nr:hypothetical protein [Trifolium medium]
MKRAKARVRAREEEESSREGGARGRGNLKESSKAK